VNMLAMTSTGYRIVAGTDNGTVEFYDATGTLSWTIYSNTGTGSGQAIKAVALTNDGSKIIAGSYDGKVLLINATGNPIWTYTTAKDPIRRVAVAADGSLAVAASDTTIYAFTTGHQDSRQYSMMTPIKTTISAVSSQITSTHAETPTTVLVTVPPSVSETPSVTMTEYSVIRKATQSPLDGIAIMFGLLVLLLVLRR
jgi:WD40 repeat protein